VKASFSREMALTAFPQVSIYPALFYRCGES
jgi:hypothetical protein